MATSSVEKGGRGEKPGREFFANTIYGIRRYKTSRWAFALLQNGYADVIAFPAESPAAGWIEVRRDDNDSAFVWVRQTDVNPITNKSFAATESRKISKNELIPLLRAE